MPDPTNDYLQLTTYYKALHDDINQMTGWAAPPPEPNAPSTTTKQ